MFARSYEVYRQMCADMIKLVELVPSNKEWCKRALARDENGEQLYDPDDPRAVSWCILGALHKIDVCADLYTFLNLSAIKSGFSSIDRLNDLVEFEDFAEFYELVLMNIVETIKRYEEKKGVSCGKQIYEKGAS